MFYTLLRRYTYIFDILVPSGTVTGYSSLFYIYLYTYIHSHVCIPSLHIYIHILHTLTSTPSTFICAYIYSTHSHLHTYKIRNPGIVNRHRSRRRSDWKYLHVQIGRFSCPLFSVKGTPVYLRENLFEIVGTSWKLENLFKITRTPVKTCRNFGSRNCFNSNLLRLWFNSIYIHLYIHRSRRRPDSKYLHLQIGQFSCPLFWVTKTPVYPTPVITVWNFGDSRENLCESDGDSRENLL